MSYQAKDSSVFGTQLSVQEVTVQLGNPIISATSGSTITINFQETLASVAAVLFVDDSAGTVAPVAAANRTVSGSTLALTLSAALAANDAVIVQYSTID